MDWKIMVILAITCSWARAMGSCSPDYCAAMRCATSKAECAAREQGYRLNATNCGYCRASVDYADDEPCGCAKMAMTEGGMTSNTPCPLCQYYKNFKQYLWT